MPIIAKGKLIRDNGKLNRQKIRNYPPVTDPG
jgi:hypothetical protein